MTFPHLDGRAAILADSLDLPTELAEWLAATALHSGCFLRSQLQFFFGYSEENRVSTFRIIRKLISKKLIVETPLDTLGLLARVTNKSIYRLLKADNIRHRRTTSWPITFRRLLALDFILDHPHLPWLATEPEKVACFDHLGIDRSLLPRRTWSGASGRTIRLFGNKHPIAVDTYSKQSWFLYADSDEQSHRGLQNWRNEHSALWSELYRLGFALFIVHASFNTRLETNVSRVFSSWTRQPLVTTPSPEIATKLLAIKDAIGSNDHQALEDYGGFNNALQTGAALEEQLSLENAISYSASYSTWLSERLMQATSNPNPSGSHSRNS
ncbi:MAG: hypothetical protein OXB98_06110 [Bryobacterales bacterium]|nr:hypothetical protein [Bryobacterales bacterium]